jgi:hypothetical protein
MSGNKLPDSATMSVPKYPKNPAENQRVRRNRHLISGHPLSGGKARQDGLDRVLEMPRPGSVLARPAGAFAQAQIELMAELEGQGIGFQSVTEAIPESTPELSVRSLAKQGDQSFAVIWPPRAVLLLFDDAASDSGSKLPS